MQFLDYAASENGYFMAFVETLCTIITADIEIKGVG